MPIGIPENRDPGPYKNRKTGTLQKPENRDPTKTGKPRPYKNRDPGPYKNRKTGTLVGPYKNQKTGTLAGPYKNWKTGTLAGSYKNRKTGTLQKLETGTLLLLSLIFFIIITLFSVDFHITITI